MSEIHDDRLRDALARLEPGVDASAGWAALQRRRRRDRHRRSAMIAVGGAVVLVSGFVAVTALREPNASDPSPPLDSVPDATTPGVTTTAPVATTSGDDPSVDVFAAATAAAATSQGVFVAVDGEWQQVGDAEPQGERAIPVGAYVVSEDRATSAPMGEVRTISILATDRTREWPAAPGYVRLLDAAVVDGHPTMLVEIRTSGADPPVDTEAHLVLVDLDSLAETDLGVFGGWESGTSTATIGRAALALKRYSNASEWVQVVGLDGTEQATIELDDDRGWTVSGDGDTAWAHLVEFLPPEFVEPVVVGTIIDLTTMATTSFSTPLRIADEPVDLEQCAPSHLTATALSCATGQAPLIVSFDPVGTPTSVEVIDTVPSGLVIPRHTSPATTSNTGTTGSTFDERTTTADSTPHDLPRR